MSSFSYVITFIHTGDHTIVSYFFYLCMSSFSPGAMLIFLYHFHFTGDPFRDPLLYRDFANKANYDSIFYFVFWIAFHERDWDALRIFSRPIVWTAFLELSIADLGDRSEL